VATRRQTGHHGETQVAAEGFQATLEQGFEWINANARLVLVVLGTFIAVGGLSALVYELVQTRAENALGALAEVERRFAIAMGARPGASLIPEPANAEQAKRAREEALAGFQQVSQQHAGSLASHAAEIRSAELEIDLGRVEAALERLRALIAGMRADDAERAVALRLVGYVLEELERPLEAAEAYAEAGDVSTYRARPAAWALAGDSFARAGQLERAVDAYAQVIAIDSEYAQATGATQRLAELQPVVGSPAPGISGAPAAETAP
jgi:tetratricopeptide (TPR) repeat protein